MLDYRSIAFEIVMSFELISESSITKDKMVSVIASALRDVGNHTHVGWRKSCAMNGVCWMANHTIDRDKSMFEIGLSLAEAFLYISSILIFIAFVSFSLRRIDGSHG